MTIGYIVLGLLAAFILYRAFKNKNLPSVTVSEAKSIQKAKSALFLDVRTSGEWASGHVQGAVHIPLQDLSSRLAELDKYKSREIIVYCHSGNRSSSATQLLVKKGFKVKNMTGGYMSW